MDANSFIWTDELWKECEYYVYQRVGIISPPLRHIFNLVQEFKKSKTHQIKQESQWRLRENEQFNKEHRSGEDNNV